MGLPLFMLINPKPSYDCAESFVVAAESEDQARALVSAPSRTDTDDPHNNLHAGDEGRHFWMDPVGAPGKLIAPDSIYDVPTVVVRAFHGA